MTYEHRTLSARRPSHLPKMDALPPKYFRTSVPSKVDYTYTYCTTPFKP
jgi:hypothetical protein